MEQSISANLGKSFKTSLSKLINSKKQGVLIKDLDLARCKTFSLLGTCKIATNLKLSGLGMHYKIGACHHILRQLVERVNEQGEIVP